MAEPRFFPPPVPLSVAEIAEIAGARLANAVDPGRRIHGIAPLDRAGPLDLAFLDNPRYVDQLAHTTAGACLCQPRHVGRVPEAVAALEVRRPQLAFAVVAARFFPAAMRPQPIIGLSGIAPGAHVDPAARLEEDVTIEPGAVLGPGSEIGAGSRIGPGAVIGPEVRIGRGCSIGTGVTVTHALIGNRVILHPGVRIGQDGFGYAAGASGLLKVPQVGRVVIQDDVEIGANSTIDRGANRDTVIGEGTKIDNQVQIGHNVVIGRHCIIVAQVGISGSATLGDGVAIGGQSGVNGHVTIGNGAQIAAVSTVHGDVPAGARWGGTPARPVREWFRAEATLRRLARGGGAAREEKEGEGE